METYKPTNRASISCRTLRAKRAATIALDAVAKRRHHHHWSAAFRVGNPVARHHQSQKQKRPGTNQSAFVEAMNNA